MIKKGYAGKVLNEEIKHTKIEKNKGKWAFKRRKETEAHVKKL